MRERAGLLLQHANLVHGVVGLCVRAVKGVSHIQDPSARVKQGTHIFNGRLTGSDFLSTGAEPSVEEDESVDGQGLTGVVSEVLSLAGLVDCPR